MPRPETGAIQGTVPRSPLLAALADRSLVAKSMIATAAMALVAVLLGVLAVTQVSDLRDDLDTMKSRHVDGLQQIANIRAGIGEMTRGVLIAATARGDRAVAEGRAAVAAADRKVTAAVAAYDAIYPGNQARHADVAAFAESMRTFRALRDGVMFRQPMPAGLTLPPEPQQEAAFEQLETAMYGAIGKLQAAEGTSADAIAAAGDDEYRTARLWTVLALVLGLLLAGAISLAVARLVRRQLTSVRDALGAVADGDLTVPAEVRARDELGLMAEAVNRAREGLRDTIGSLTTGSVTLGDSTRRLTGVTARIAESAQEAATRPGWWRRPPRTCPPTCRRWPRAASRWARRSGRSPRTPTTPHWSPPRPSGSPRAPTRPSASSARRPRRSATWSR